MYDILELNKKKVEELREIAEKMNLEGFDKLKKQELVYGFHQVAAAYSSTAKSLLIILKVKILHAQRFYRLKLPK